MKAKKLDLRRLEASITRGTRPDNGGPSCTLKRGNSRRIAFDRE
jgi:hypothetical protein